MEYLAQGDELFEEKIGRDRFAYQTNYKPETKNLNEKWVGGGERAGFSLTNLLRFLR